MRQSFGFQVVIEITANSRWEINLLDTSFSIAKFYGQESDDFEQYQQTLHFLL